MGNVLQIANDLLTKANRFAYGATPIGRAMGEVGRVAQNAGNVIRRNPSPVNIAGELFNTGASVANVLPQSLFHTLKMTPASRIGVQTPMGRADLPGASSLALGLLANPLGAIGKAQKANKVLGAASKQLGQNYLKGAGGKFAGSKAALTKLFHGTDKVFDDFDVRKTADGSVWFTDNKLDILDPKRGVAAAGKGIIMERKLPNSLKLAHPDDIDKYSVDQLINQGFDGVKYPGDETTGTYYQIFHPRRLKK